MENELFINNKADVRKSQVDQENSNFPIHRLVWNNNYVDLRDFLKQFQSDVEQRDNRGRTPLHLAIALGHLESANVLLESGASALAENTRNWTVVQEAVSTGDPEMVQLCLQYRDYQRHMERLHGVPKLLKQLEEAPDFYVEMKWEFTSWVPLVSRICPSDTYKVWKSGSNVRIDTTLLGFDNMSWQRGSRSYLFKLHGNATTLLEVDYDNCQVYSETLSPSLVPPTVAYMSPSTNAVAARLTSPIVTTFVDIDKISFERSKSGVWGWRSDRMDVVDNFTCKVFSASNVQLATKTRTEHLSEEDKRRIKKQSRTPFESFLGVAETDPKNKGTDSNGPSTTTVCRNPCHVTEEEYFGPCDLEGRDVGRPAEETTKVQKLKARFWLSEDYPLSLPDQVVPIIDLMASSNTHFRKLKDFIALQLPSGFPVKIEIPLFHVLNARITFTNLFSRDTPVEGVVPVKSEGDQGEVLACAIDESTFAVPSSYSVIGDIHHERLQDEDDELYQFTLRQSLLQQSDDERIQDLMLKRTRSSHSRLASEEERLLQWALEESLKESRSCDSLPPLATSTPPGTPPPYSQNPMGDETPSYEPLRFDRAPPDGDYERQLRIALELSQKEEEEELMRRRQDEEDLARVMELSLLDK